MVQGGERNAFDQRALEWSLGERHGIRCIRMTLAEVLNQAHLDAADRTLRVPDPTRADGSYRAVSVVYFRAAYSPNDYLSQREWDARLLIERSRAIKCPTVAMQLAGAKKVQQVLAEPGELARFVSSADTAAALRSTFAGMWALSDETVAMIRRDPSGFVLKPQREGGGNNIYGADIPPFLDSLPARAVDGYILMELIRPPRDEIVNVVLRAGSAAPTRGTDGEGTGGVISELGVYGVALFRAGPDGGLEMARNERVGHLLRTKGATVREGGVATGFSVLDSPALC